MTFFGGGQAAQVLREGISRYEEDPIWWGNNIGRFSILCKQSRNMRWTFSISFFCCMEKIWDESERKVFKLTNKKLNLLSFIWIEMFVWCLRSCWGIWWRLSDDGIWGDDEIEVENWLFIKFVNLKWKIQLFV